MKRQERSGGARTARMRLKKILSRPTTKDSFAKTVKTMAVARRPKSATPDRRA